jgi:hypothetical protein
MSFQIHALPAARFEPLVALSDRELAGMRAVRKVADHKPGVPCRVSLVDAEVGETVILLNFEHQPADSPFRSAHAIYVREGAEQALPAVGEVPELLQSRLISIRAFDAKHFMTASDVVAGSLLAEAMPALLDDPAVSYLHLHSAKPGCYLARVTRV